MRRTVITASAAIALTGGAAIALMGGAAVAQSQSEYVAGQQGGTAAPGTSTTGTTTPGTTTTTSPATTTTTGALGTGQADRTSAENMLGRTVVAADGEEIGEVEDVILDGTSGQARQIIVKSGGFLGMGGKSIAVDFTDAQMDPEGEQVQLTTLTAAQVQEMPGHEYDETTVSLSRGNADTAGGTAVPAQPRSTDPTTGTTTGTTSGTTTGTTTGTPPGTTTGTTGGTAPD